MQGEIKMKKIEMLSERIEEEIKDAEWYARSAVECKENDPASAEMFYRIANEEIGHANMLHTRVVAIIEEYKKTNGEPPSDMMKLYEYLHKKHTGNLATVKGILSLYK
jgi:ferritin